MRIETCFRLSWTGNIYSSNQEFGFSSDDTILDLVTEQTMRVCCRCRYSHIVKSKMLSPCTILAGNGYGNSISAVVKIIVKRLLRTRNSKLGIFGFRFF
jgi:hypothetical protein